MDILSSAWSVLASGGQLIPVVMMIIEIIKRFIPDRHRGYANPILAIIVGVIGVYTTGGLTEVVNILMAGLVAAAGAVAAYKVPKEIGIKLEQKLFAGVRG